MNIWVINHYADSPDRQSTRSYDLAKKLVEHGHKVTIFSAGFSHYSFKEERIRGHESWVAEDWNGVRFIWLRTFPYRNNDWRRMLNMVSFSWRAFWLGRKLPEKPDVISGVSVHPLAALAGCFLSMAKGSRFFVELTDLWPEVLIDFGRLSRHNPITWLLRALEKFLYRRAERIIMVWPRTEEYVQRLGISPDKVVWLPHLTELSRYKSLKPYDGIIRDRFVVMYLGSFVSFMDMGNILRAARVLQDRGRNEIEFVLVGGGTDKEALERLALGLELRNVKFPGLVPKNDIVRVMSDADAYIVSLRNVPLLRYGISLNKACDYLASGRPTVFAGRPGYDPIKEAKAGISVPANDPEALAEGIQELIALTPGERVQMGQNGREYVARVHSLDVVADQLERVLLGPDPEPSAPVGIAETEVTPV